MSLAGCQTIQIDVNFHLQKCLEIFDKNSADKIQSQNYKGGRNALPQADFKEDLSMHYLSIQV